MYIRCTDSSLHKIIRHEFMLFSINNDGPEPALVISNDEADAQGLKWVCSEPRETLIDRIAAALWDDLDESIVIEVQPGPIAR
jgi:hypothetical protein